MNQCHYCKNESTIKIAYNGHIHKFCDEHKDQYKICRTCKRRKPLYKFGFKRNLKKKCRDCEKLRGSYCVHCGNEKPLTESLCKSCSKYKRCNYCSSILSPLSLYSHNGKLCSFCQETDFSNMRRRCNICNEKIKNSKKRFLRTGNYCIKCHANPRKVIKKMEEELSGK